MFRVAVVLMLLASTAVAEPISGKARITDGDTIVIGRTKIRLEGIDAPEKKQPCKDQKGKPFDCGHKASQYLAELVGRVEIICVPARERAEKLAQVKLVAGRVIEMAKKAQALAQNYENLGLDIKLAGKISSYEVRERHKEIVRDLLAAYRSCSTSGGSL